MYSPGPEPQASWELQDPLARVKDLREGGGGLASWLS